MRTVNNFKKNSIPSVENSEDPDQLASDEASWSGSTLFSSQMMNPY